MKTPTTMSREKSTGGADGGRPGARACRPQTATHSSRLRMTTCAGSCIPLTNPFAKVEKGTACRREEIKMPDERMGIRALCSWGQWLKLLKPGARAHLQRWARHREPP